MIHETTVIQKGAQLGKGVTVGPYAVVEGQVTLGDNVEVGAHAHIKGNTVIGEATRIGTGALIGEMPQMAGLRENRGNLRIGKNNVIREYVTVHTSTSPDGATVIEDNNFLMGFAHIAHDCHLSCDIVVCNGALVAGHVHIQQKAFLSGYVVVHQFVRVGALAMIGGLSRVNQDVPPFMMVVGDSRVWGLNTVGLRRAQFSRRDINEIKKAFAVLYRSKLPPKRAVEKLSHTQSEKVKEMVQFIRSSKRGICGPQKSSFRQKLFLDYPYFVRTKIPTYNLFLKSRE